VVSTKASANPEADRQGFISARSRDELGSPIGTGRRAAQSPGTWATQGCRPKRSKTLDAWPSAQIQGARQFARELLESAPSAAGHDPVARVVDRRHDHDGQPASRVDCAGFSDDESAGCSLCEPCKRGVEDAGSAGVAGGRTLWSLLARIAAVRKRTGRHAAIWITRGAQRVRGFVCRAEDAGMSQGLRVF